MDLNVSREWLLRMAEAEDRHGGCTSVGGLAVTLGLYRRPDVVLEELPSLRGIHCISFGVEWIAHLGFGHSNEFWVTPRVYRGGYRPPVFVATT